MTKFLAILMSSLLSALTAFLPRWKSLTVRARLYDRMQPYETVRVGGDTLKLFIPDRTCVYWAKHGPDSEPTTLAWIDSFDRNDTFVDIGANIGLYSLIAAAKGVSRVYAFEPNPFSFSVLARNIVNNGFDSTISPFCLAMNETSSMVTFKLGGMHAGSIENAITQEGQDGGDISITTAAFSIDDLFEGQGVSGVTHLKIDVDGLELDILRGAMKLLSDEGFKSVLVEDNSTNEAEESELVSFFDTLGFQQSDTWGQDETSNRIFVKI